MSGPACRWRPAWPVRSALLASLGCTALFALFSLAGCSRAGISVPQSPLLKYLERKSGMIAVVRADGNLAVLDQGGGGERELTSDARLPDSQDGGQGDGAEGQSSSGGFVYYQTPVWAPDGSRVASVRLEGSGGALAQASIVVVPVGRGEAVTVYASATSMPALPAWSPDSSRLVFLASSPSGSSYGFYLVPAAGGEPELLDAGVPYGWAWSPRGDELLIHAGSVSGGLASGRLAFLDVEREILEEGLGIVAGDFQAPAWSADGRHVLVAAWEEGTNRLVLTNRKRSQTTRLAASPGPFAFAFSPGSQKVAYLARSEGADDSPSRLYVADVPGRGAPDASAAPRTPLSGEDVVAAFFWSPDGSRIAWVVPALVELPESQAEEGDGAGEGETAQAGSEKQAGDAAPTHAVVLTLKTADVRTGAAREVATFLPAPGFLGFVQQFAQLSQSVRIWSPDSRHLVYAAIDEQGPAIMVARAAESIAPRRIGNGLEAAWSRR